jgi:putative ABC transport system permease protein
MGKELKRKPPFLADRLFRWYCERALVEDLQGDVEEMFYADLRQMSSIRAGFRYWLRVLSLMASYSVNWRKKQAAYSPYFYTSTNAGMLGNYFKVAFRNMLRTPLYTIINISGLSIAITITMIIGLFIYREFQYDRHHARSQRIFRLDYELKFGANHTKNATTPAVAASAVSADFPDIESAVRVMNYGTYLVRSSEQKENMKEERVYWTDSTFFNIFTSNIIESDSGTPLAQPKTVAISRTVAQKYFGSHPAVGRLLILDERYEAIVTAVFEDWPATSHFRPAILISLEGDWPAQREAKSTLFSKNNYNTYILLRERANANSLESQLPGFVKKHTDLSGSDFAKLTLIPLRSIHLHSDLKGEIESNGSITYVYLFAIIALLVLAVACINFTNLSTVLSLSRMKEIGVRKVMGSHRGTLVTQFLLESLTVTGLAIAIALAIQWYCLPLFNQVYSTDLKLPIGEPLFFLILLAIGIVISLMAGIYPAFFASGFSTVDVLKGKALTSGGGILRNALVVFQFVVSIFLIVTAVGLNEQRSFIQSKKLGFEKSRVFLVKDAYALRPNSQVFKNRIANIKGVEATTISGFIPVEGGAEFPRRDRTFWKEGNSPSTENLLSIQQWSVDSDYIKTFKLNLLDGRNFSHDMLSDEAAVILNETAVRYFGLGDEPVGKKVLTFTGREAPDFEHPAAYTVIGVVKDFHFASLENSISPLGLFLGKSDGFVAIRYQGNPYTVISEVEKIWKDMAVNQPFQSSFVEDEYEKMYQSEQRIAKLFSLFAALAIVIACIGLFAIVGYSTTIRTREIGIRKVLGATVPGILIMLSKEFLLLLSIAVLIAVPIGWYSLQSWLQRFSYHAEMGLWIFVLPAILVSAIACITIWIHSFKAAIADPVTALKT